MSIRRAGAAGLILAALGGFAGGLALPAGSAAAQSAADRAAVDGRVIPVQATCLPRLRCWRDHWGYGQCVREWQCDERFAPGWRGRRFVPEDYPPGAGVERHERSRWRRRAWRDDHWDDRPRARWNAAPDDRRAVPGDRWSDRWDQREGPAVLRPRRVEPPRQRDRRQVTVLPRLKTVPDARSERGPEAKPDADPRTKDPGEAMRKEPEAPEETALPDAKSETETRVEPERRATPETAPRLTEPPQETAPDNPEERVPNAMPERKTDRETEPDTRAEPAPEVEVVPRRAAPTRREAAPDRRDDTSARLKEPPAPDRSPGRDRSRDERAPTVRVTPLPDGETRTNPENERERKRETQPEARRTPAPKDVAPKPELDRRDAPEGEKTPRGAEKPGDSKPDAKSRQDEIDKLPRGRRIPMEELDPSLKPEKPQRERMPI